MQNVFAVLLALIAFTATVALVNAQGTAPENAFSFDIREAAETLAAQMAYLIEGQLAESGVRLPFFGALALAGLGLALPAVFVFTLLGRTGR